MKYIFPLLLLLIVTACNDNIVFEAYQDMPNNEWLYKSPVQFNFSIDDTSNTYLLRYKVRNTLSYPFYNLYVTYQLKDTANHVLYANKHETNLLNPKTGEPYGKGSGEYFEHNILLIPILKFKQKGNYKIELSQYMRLDTLPHINTVGIEVAKRQ
jgi:gliding motility-associated lipoprotein GldH